MKITTNAPKANWKGTIEVDLPSTLDGLVAEYGEQVVFSRCMDSLVIAIQARVRGLVQGSKNLAPIRKVEDVQAAIEHWIEENGFRPQERANVVERTAKEVDRMSDEQQLALLAKLEAKLKGRTE